MVFFISLDELKVGAEQAVHVGDDATADKAGAEALGIKAWLVSGRLMPCTNVTVPKTICSLVSVCGQKALHVNCSFSLTDDIVN